MQRKKTVFLDLDGTLTDSGPGIINSFNHALIQMGYTPLGQDADWIVGPSLWDSFTKYGVPADQLDTAIAHYRTCYRGGEMLNNQLYDGVYDQLTQLHDMGYNLCLATSKPIAYAAEITEHFGLTHLFADQIGSELDGSRSDKAELLEFGMTRLGCKPQDAIMIGDRHYDVMGAKAVGIACLGALYGFGSRDELITAGAVALLNTAHELGTSVTTHLPIGE